MATKADMPDTGALLKPSSITSAHEMLTASGPWTVSGTWSNQDQARDQVYIRNPRRDRLTVTRTDGGAWSLYGTPVWFIAA